MKMIPFSEPLARMAGRVLGEPNHLIVFVTRTCNLACEHCFVPGLPCPAPEASALLTVEEVRRLAPTLPRLGTLSITGGEPFTRRDLPELVEAFLAPGRIRSLMLVTNGWFTDRILETVRATLAHDIDRLIVRISLDGPPEIHDRIRRQQGSYERAVETFSRLRLLRPSDQRLQMGTNTTYQARNREVVEDFLETLAGLGPDTISLNYLRGQPADPSSRSEDIDGFLSALALYTGANRFSFRRAYKAVLGDLIAGRLRAPCRAGSLIAVLRENGDLYPCEMLGRRMANLREHGMDFAAAWSSDAAEELRRYARTECEPCSWECVIPYNIVSDPELLLRVGGRFLRELLRGNRP